MHTVSRKIFGRYVSVYLTMYQIKTLSCNSLVFLFREIKSATICICNFETGITHARFS